jgi:hypothetical protein
MSSFHPQDYVLRVVFMVLLPLVLIVFSATFMTSEADFRLLFFNNQFLVYALFSIYVMHVILCDQPQERRSVMIVGIVILATIPVVSLGGDAANIPAVTFAGAATLATASLFVQTRGILRSDNAARRLRLTLLRNSLIIPLAVSVTPFFLWLSSTINPTFDPLLFAFEASLAVQPSAKIASLLDAVRPLRWLCKLVYSALPFAMGVLCAYQYRGAGGPNIIVLFVAATAVGFALYFVFPIAGPPTLLGDAYPRDLASLTTLPPEPLALVQDGHPRNGMPSLHAAWAYLLWFNARHLPALPRRAFAAFAIFTLLAAVGLRDAGHWMIDLVVALPLAVAVQAACSAMIPWRVPERRIALAAGIMMVAIWLIALRYGVTAVFAIPGLSWLAISITVAVSLVLERRLTGILYRAPPTVAALAAP